MNGLQTKIKKVPDVPGIYQFIDSQGKILYIGKAKSLKRRILSYFQNKNLGPKTNLMVSKIADTKFIKVFSEFEALLLEAALIKENQPFYNTNAKDDKSPLYIKITSDEIPLITAVRNEKPKRGVYLKGPFPNSKTAKDVLKIIRKIFPYCHHKNPRRPCLYVHLGLCPYPYKSNDSKNSYLRNIERIKKLLKGQSKRVILELKRVMEILSKNQEFEQANDIKIKIQQLEFLISSYHSPLEFLERPTLVDDLTMAKLADFKETLEISKTPKRIECFDISNISGKLATGSMVVFENGKTAKNQYRRFRIKFSDKPNDYQMLKEVLTRRFKNNWPLPDLLIIDGGRGQLNVAINVLSKSRLSIPVISLAKRQEEIYMENKILPIALKKESPVRQLVQEIRDEAHRFALNYHRLLRSKQLLEKF